MNQMENQAISALRMERQCLMRQASSAVYDALFRDMQPGYNVYWNGFGDPPSLMHRANFDDLEYNRRRQADHALLKLRLGGGNLGWIVPADLELFAGLYRKPLANPTPAQTTILTLIERQGPMTIQQIKEETGFLVKEITPILHRLQEAFSIYEDQYDGEWDRGWYRFGDMFPDANTERFTRIEALKAILPRFAYRCVQFDTKMAKSYYKLPEKDIKAAIALLLADGTLAEADGGYMLKTDIGVTAEAMRPSVFVIHKNDFLYRAHEHLLKEPWKRAGFETLYYVLVDGEFHGAAYGKFRYGPPDFDDLAVNLPEAEARRDEIIKAVKRLSCNAPEKYNGKALI